MRVCTRFFTRDLPREVCDVVFLIPVGFERFDYLFEVSIQSAGQTKVEVRKVGRKRRRRSLARKGLRGACRGCENVEECRGKSGGADRYRELFEDRRKGEFVFDETEKDGKRGVIYVEGYIITSVS